MQDKEEKKPLTYLDREVRKNDNFVFISYSHRNNETIDTLYRLFDHGVNYWYDVKFKPGDKWDNEAIRQLRKDNCVGAIVFISNFTIISDACHKEIIEMIEISKENKNFSIIPVLIGYNAPARAYDDTKNRVENGEFEENIKSNKQFSLEEKIEAFKVITGGNSVISPSYSSEDYKWLDGLVDTLGLLGIVEKQMFYLQNTPFTSKLDTRLDHSKNAYILNYGSYPFDIEGNDEIITWIVIWQERNILTLVSEYVLDYDFKDNIEGVLESIKNSFKQSDFIIEMGIIDDNQLELYKEYIGRFVSTDYADSKRGQLIKLNFIKKVDAENQYLLVNTNGSKYVVVNKTSCNNYGIRLMMKINIEKI